jgi:hypothetical protein
MGFFCGNKNLRNLCLDVQHKIPEELFGARFTDITICNFVFVVGQENPFIGY